MKKVAFFFILMLNINAYSQNTTKLQKQIDSLKVIRLDYQNKIEKVNSLISELENKKIISDLGKNESLKYTVTSENVKIREADYSASNIKFSPKIGEEIELIDFNNTTQYWKVSYKNSFGYLNDVFIGQTLEVKNFKKGLIAKNTLKDEEQKKLNAKRQAEQTAVQKERRKKDLINIYGTEIATKILAGKIWLGMTSEMTKESWGSPDKNNRTVGTWGVHEQWIYGDTYVYFENGILTSWQDTK